MGLEASLRATLLCPTSSTPAWSRSASTTTTPAVRGVDGLTGLEYVPAGEVCDWSWALGLCRFTGLPCGCGGACLAEAAETKVDASERAPAVATPDWPRPRSTASLAHRSPKHPKRAQARAWPRGLRWVKRAPSPAGPDEDILRTGSRLLAAARCKLCCSLPVVLRPAVGGAELRDACLAEVAQAKAVGVGCGGNASWVWRERRPNKARSLAGAAKMLERRQPASLGQCCAAHRRVLCGIAERRNLS